MNDNFFTIKILAIFFGFRFISSLRAEHVRLEGFYGAESDDIGDVCDTWEIY